MDRIYKYQILLFFSSARYRKKRDFTRTNSRSTEARITENMRAFLQTIPVISNSCRFYFITKHFKGIPGPKQFPFIGNSLLFSPFGPYKVSKLVEAHKDLHRKYGPIIKMNLGIPMILLFNPDDVCVMYRNEGQHPMRLMFEALNKYRKENKDKYLHMGIVSDNGISWQLMRQHVGWLLRPSVPLKYLIPLEEVANEFVKSIQSRIVHTGYIHDFLSELYCFTQESIGVVCFGIRLGCLSNSGNVELPRAVNDSLEAMADTVLGLPWWKIWKTAPFRKLERSQNFIWKTTLQYTQASRKQLLEEPVLAESNPFLHYILGIKHLDFRDTLLIISEIFQGGIDATATTIAFTLYHLAKNPDVQMKLVSEIKQKLQGKVTPPAIQSLSYLRGCIKETLRLNPTAVGSARIMPSEVVLGGFRIPAGNLILGCHPVISRKEKYFPEPNAFIPERWIRGHEAQQKIHPFASLPFGFGARMCPGRRLAELEIMLCLIKILEQFHVEYEEGEIGMKMRLNLMPDRPLTFKFTQRT